MQDNLFPFTDVRPEQSVLIDDVRNAIKNKQNLIAHAPTGLGKTAASLVPAVEYAIANNKKVLFLTSRHTQHKIAIETVQAINKKHDAKIIVADFIGKKWMCAQESVENLSATEFWDYCKNLREKNECEYYVNFKAENKVTPLARKVSSDMIKLNVVGSNNVRSMAKEEKLCPYEMALLIGQEAKVLVGDYYHLFHPIVGENFLKKTNTELGNCIIIIDEAHNLPSRITNLLTTKLTANMLRRAIKEIKNDEDLRFYLDKIGKMLFDISSTFKAEEKIIRKELLIDEINEIVKYEELIEALDSIASQVREEKKLSYCNAVARFLEKWLEEDEAFVRILGKTKDSIEVKHICLDPSLLAKGIIDNAHSVILMSGTLIPTYMYRDILGFDAENTIEKNYKNPFPKENKLELIVPKTTTKFTKRSEREFAAIGKICSDMAARIPGNVAVFFPSYGLRNDIARFIVANKTVFFEKQDMAKEEKEKMLDEFKKNKDKGSLLLGVVAANFSEGIDLPGDLLNGVIVVGLPLEKPDLHIKSLIAYYDAKFGKGWEYGYEAPAFNKCLQACGRCIRSETDRGAIILLDERYCWERYSKYLRNNNFIATGIYGERLKEFFNP